MLNVFYVPLPAACEHSQRVDADNSMPVELHNELDELPAERRKLMDYKLVK